jgi:hypothetical protein
MTFLFFYHFDLNIDFRDDLKVLVELIGRGPVDRRVFFGEVEFFESNFDVSPCIFVFAPITVCKFLFPISKRYDVRGRCI